VVGKVEEAGKLLGTGFSGVAAVGAPLSLCQKSDRHQVCPTAVRRAKARTSTVVAATIVLAKESAAKPPNAATTWRPGVGAIPTIPAAGG